MKKILVLFLCVLLICAMPIVASAEGTSEDAVETNPTVTDGVPAEEDKPITEIIVGYVKSNPEEVIVMISVIFGAIYEFRHRRKLNGSIGTLNNNAVVVAENSATAIKAALKEAEDIANVVKEYKEEFATILNDVRKNAEEKQSLEDTLNHVETFLKTAKLATLELSNEVAELLLLANIPNSKKEELYARHSNAVHSLEAVEEVKSNDGKET